VLTIRERPRDLRKRRYRRHRRSWRRCRSDSHIPWRCPPSKCSTFCNPPDGRVCWSCRMRRSLHLQPDTWNLRRPLRNATDIGYRVVQRGRQRERHRVSSQLHCQSWFRIDERGKGVWRVRGFTDKDSRCGNNFIRERRRIPRENLLEKKICDLFTKFSRVR